MLGTIASLFDVRRRVQTMTTTAALLLTAMAVLAIAAGFGLSLFYFWLQQIYGSMVALAIVAGVFAGLSLILFLIAFLRPARRPHPAPQDGERVVADTVRLIEDALAGVQKGSRETLVTTVLVAVLAGLTLGRKL
jgi:hypothetical protein